MEGRLGGARLGGDPEGLVQQRDGLAREALREPAPRVHAEEVPQVQPGERAAVIRGALETRVMEQH